RGEADDVRRVAEDAAAPSRFAGAAPATRLNVARLSRPRAPVAQGIERCPAEAEVACSNHAGRISRSSRYVQRRGLPRLRSTVGEGRPPPTPPAIRADRTDRRSTTSRE